MPEPKSVSYLSGEDPGTYKANLEYQQALNAMLASLDSRKNRMFDPTLLALAEGFLKPAPTFGESLGNVAGNLRKTQDLQFEQDQKLAEARLGLAGKGLELERQRARERAFMQEIGGPAEAAAMPTPGGPAGAAPTGAPGAVPAGGQPAAGAAAPQGIRVSPGDPKFPTREQFLNRQRLDGKPLTDAMKAWDDLRKQNEEVRDVGTLNRATGMFYPNPNVSEVDRKIGQSTYTVPAGLAFRLDAAQMSGNADEYQRLANEFLSGKVSGAPPRSKQQSELEQEEAKTFAVESAKKAVEQESKLETQYDSARRLNSSATRLIDLVSKNPRGFGQFMTPDLMGAIGTLLTSTVRAGGTTIGLGDVEDTVRKLSANMTKADLNAVSLALSELANIELAYTQMDLGKQGAITEGERAIVRRLGGSISDSPEVLLQKALLVKNNAEFNIKLTRKFYEMQEADPKLTVSKFRRSKEYRQMEEEHDRNVSTMFAPRASVSPAAPGAAPARPAGAGPAPTAPARPSTGAPAATSRPPGAATPQGSGATPMYPGATGRLNDMGFGIGSGR